MPAFAVTLRLLLLTFSLVLFTACAAPPAGTSSDDMSSMDHSGTLTTENGTGHDMDAMSQGVAALTDLSGEAFDVAFLDAMIPHHASAVTMAQIAAERSNNADIQAAAHDIIAAQTSEISQMTAWLNDWYQEVPSGDDHGMSMTSEVELLRSVPAAEFDAAFLRAMIPHHQSAIEMAELVPNRTTRPELTTLARSIIDTQTAEIAQYEAWLAE